MFARGGAATFPRHALLLLWQCAILLASGPLFAAPPTVVVCGQRVSCVPEPVLIGGEVHVPVTFQFPGLPVTARLDGSQVVVRGLGESEMRAPAVLHQGVAYYALAPACAGIRLGTRWVERQQTLYVAPRIDSIRPEIFDRMLTLRLTAGYPVSAKVSVLTNPSRLLVEIPNAHLFAESTVIPIDQAGIERIRAAQYSYDPPVVRVVVDVAGKPQYRLLSSEQTTHIRLRLGVPEAPTAEASALLDQMLDSPDSEATTRDLLAVTVEAADDTTARIVIRTTAPVDGSVSLLSSPPRLALDIPNTALRSTPPEVPPGTPLVAAVRLGQFTPSIARVVVDLLEEVEYTLEKGPDPSTLVVVIRSALSFLPVRGIVGLKVMLDPGHGGTQAGTTGLSGRREQDLNLDVAKRVYRLLEDAKARPRMTRYGDDTVGLYARPALANAWGAHIFISIHANSNGRANSARGIETYYCHAHSYRLAQAVHNQLVRELGAPDRKVRQRPGLVVTREAKMPAILVEIGYMNHREEDRLLGTPEYRQRVAKAIFNGILNYVGESVAAENPTSEESDPGQSFSEIPERAAQIAGEENL